MAVRAWMCPQCGNYTIIQVAVDKITKKPFYSCHSEDCLWEAELLVRLDDGPFITHYELLNNLMEVAKEKRDE